MVTNYSNTGVIRLEISVPMPYAESFPRVKAMLLEAMQSVPKVLSEPAPDIGIAQFDSHNIQLLARPYVVPDDYWSATFEVQEKIKAIFNKNNVKVAYSEGVEMGDIGE